VEKDRVLRYDLGDGKKLICYFVLNKFFQAWYEPSATDADQETVENVLAGLNRKYGTEDPVGFLDNKNRPWLVTKWSDGITSIEYRMLDPKAPQFKNTPYASSEARVIYTDIEINAKKEKMRKRSRSGSTRKSARKSNSRSTATYRTSSRGTCRQAPGASPRSVSRPMAARTRRKVGKPTAAVMRRTCRCGLRSG